MGITDVKYLQDIGDAGLGTLKMRRPPHNSGRPIRFFSAYAKKIFLQKHDLVGKVGEVDGYNIIVLYIGSMLQEFDQIPTGIFITEEILNDLKTMTAYYENKIKHNQSRFKKFKIKKA